MADRSQPETIDVFKTLWREWIRIICLCAVRGAKWRSVAPGDYLALHAELLDIARSFAEHDDPETRRLWREIERTLEPWMTLETLSRPDREIVVKLVGHCEAVLEVFEGRSWWRRNRRRVGSVMVTVGIAVAITLLIRGGGHPAISPFRGVAMWFWRLGGVFGGDDSTRKLVLGGSVAMIAVIVLVWRSTRPS